MTTDALISKDAMGAFLDPIDNILAASRPKEAHADTEQRFVDAKVATNRAAVKHVENQTAERGGHDNEQKRVARLEALTDNKSAMMDAQVVVASKLLESRVQTGDGAGSPIGARRQMTEERSGGRVRGVS